MLNKFVIALYPVANTLETTVLQFLNHTNSIWLEHRAVHKSTDHRIEIILYEFAFKRSLCWLRRSLLDVLTLYACVVCSLPPCDHLECKSV